MIEIGRFYSTMDKNTMSKIPECDRCTLYAHNPHLVCAVHPDGVETDKCSDFRPHPNAEVQKQWSPQGYS